MSICADWELFNGLITYTYLYSTEAQQPVTNSSPKDKSQWRKSNLNIATSRDEAEINAKRLRRLRSRTQIDIPDESTQIETDRTKESQVFFSLFLISLLINQWWCIHSS
jgi:hypothetical protein